MGTKTPWGVSDQKKKIAPGIMSYSTPSHGGIHLSVTKNAKVHEAWRISDGWYEEDQDTTIVFYTFPEFFPSISRGDTISTLKNAYPDEYERITGEVLVPGESVVKDERQFLKDHEKDWIVISAIIFNEDPSKVKCIATQGGKRALFTDKVEPQERVFLVPADEYDKRSSFGFVIDCNKHSEIASTID